MSEFTGDRPFRRRVFGGYRPADVEIAIAQLRLANSQLAARVEDAWKRAHDLEAELGELKRENEQHREREQEVAQAMTSAHRRAAEIEGAAEARARSLVGEAEERAARLRSEAAQQTERVSSQLDELMRIKDSLVQQIRGVLRDFGYVVERIERGESVTPPEPAPAQAPASVPAAAVAEPAVPGDAGSRADDEVTSDLRVEIDAGPFVDFTTLSAFERALARLPKVEDVYVRRFAADRAVIELTLSEPVALARAVRDFLPYAVEIASIDRRRLSLNIVSFTTPETEGATR